MAEMVLVTVSVDTQYFSNGGLSWLIQYMGEVLRWVIITTSLFALFYYFTRDNSHKNLRLAGFSSLRLALNLFSFIGFYALTLKLFGSPGEAGTEPNQSSWAVVTLLSALWLALGLMIFVFWLKFLLESRSLVTFLLGHKHKLLYAGLLAIAILLVNYLVYNQWKPPSIINFTLYSTEWLLSLLGQSVFIYPEDFLLGINDFIVLVSVECSGIEGLIIALSSTAIYLYFLRKELSFPRALLLFPIAAVISVTFNVIRIAALILIGAYFSPEIAVGGFHSVAGWISAIFVAALIIFVFSSFSFFHKPGYSNETVAQQDAHINDDSNLARAMLAPFIVFLFATLALQIFLDDFDYLYPIKAIAGVLALAFCWKHYQFRLPQKWLEPLLAGLAIAILWILLVPADAEYNLGFSESLAEMPLWMMLGWFFFRFLGAWVVIPFVEEMIFRGYLLARLSGQELSNSKTPEFSWVALIGSSVFFAFMHSAIIAGLVAGVIFALIRYRSKSLSEAVLAHAAANVFVSAWAVATGQWVVM